MALPDRQAYTADTQSFGLYGTSCSNSMENVYYTKHMYDTASLKRSIEMIMLGNQAPVLFKKPIQVSINVDENGDFIASDDILLRYGVGGSAQQAVRDYLQDLADYYEAMAEEEDPDTLSYFKWIDSYVGLVST